METRNKKNYPLDFKIGQMIMTGFQGTAVDETSHITNSLLNNHLGTVWLVDNGNSQQTNIGNIESKVQLKKLTSDLQNFSNGTLLISIDAEGGEVIRLKEKYGFPKIKSAQFYGSLNDLKQSRMNAELIASILSEHGINFNLAPVVDLNVNPDCPIIAKKERSFSSNPEIVAAHAYEFILAHKEKRIATCLKHFPGHGSSASDTHKGFVDVTNLWTQKELIPYKELISKNIVDAIMTAHIYNSNLDEKYPATLSKKIITGLLREKLGFGGVIITDDLIMKAIYNYYPLEKSIELAINAGADIIVYGNAANYNPFITENMIRIIKNLLDKELLSEKRIDDSFNRIMKLKNSIGLIHN